MTFKKLTPEGRRERERETCCLPQAPRLKPLGALADVMFPPIEPHRPALGLELLKLAKAPTESCCLRAVEKMGNAGVEAKWSASRLSLI